MSKKILEKYQQFYRFCGKVGLLGIVGIHSMVHFFPEKYMRTVSTPNCQATDPRHIELLIESCKNMKIDPGTVSLVYISAFSTRSAGMMYFTSKAVIGLSRSCNFQDAKEVADEVTFQNNAVDPTICESLWRCLALSEDELRFLIGHELVHIKDQHWASFIIQSSGLFYLFYKAGLCFPTLFKNMPFLVIVAANAILWSVFYLTYRQTRKLLSHFFEYESDKKSALLGNNYCDGGITYSKKKLMLNQLLRTMNSKDGSSMYSKEGDNLFQSSHPKRTERLNALIDLKKHFYK